ncbi:uncharacterized protein LOC131479251 [Ochotona princeps]|uniref:uncharacterized protein LOC131479251 n=1 Tax=Ochotona princeps TaxID=9978 RepID=UPI002714AB89|nr:uncharacterized protein LOC131479251 [Ochotona princeps]
MASAESWKALLEKRGADEPLQKVIDGLLTVCSKIATALRGTEVEALGQQNAFGDEQLTVDVLAERLLRNYAEKESLIKAISSEEDTPLKECHEDGEFILCWDPLDGSSIVDCNWSVGTIVGIWRLQHHGLHWKGTETLVNQTGRQQVAAVVVVYGPRTTAVVALNPSQQGAAQQEQMGDALQEDGQEGRSMHGKKCIFSVRLADDGAPVVVGEPRIRSQAKIFAPANLRAAQDLPEYQRLVNYWMEKRYTLRYTGVGAKEKQRFRL